MLTPEDVEQDERRHGHTRRRWWPWTGWAARHYTNRDAYYNVTDWTDIDEATGLARLHFPGVSEGAARLLRDRGAVGVCIDTMALDGPGVSGALRELLQRDAYVVANANLKEELPARGARLTVAPLLGGLPGRRASAPAPVCIGVCASKPRGGAASAASRVLRKDGVAGGEQAGSRWGKRRAAAVFCLRRGGVPCLRARRPRSEAEGRAHGPRQAPRPPCRRRPSKRQDVRRRREQEAGRGAARMAVLSVRRVVPEEGSWCFHCVGHRVGGRGTTMPTRTTRRE